MHPSGAGRGPPPPPPPAVLLHVEQQFQERIARAQAAARLASIAAASQAQPPPSYAAAPPVSGVPYHLPLHRPPPPPAAVARPPPMASIPPAVKHRIDRLVEFVARNGEAFEATACQRERGNPDFAFLTPGAPYADYYQWKKQQICGPKPPILPTSSLPGPAGPSELMSTMSVGALANVCRLARASGVPAYAPIPREIMLSVGTLPPVEPARLEIRLAEFYRVDNDADRSKRSVY